MPIHALIRFAISSALLTLVAAGPANAGKFDAVCMDLDLKLFKACNAKCQERWKYEQDHDLDRTVRQCADACDSDAVRRKSQFEATYNQQQQGRCGPFCLKQHPGQCPQGSAYATCVAQCNSGPMPKAKPAVTKGPPPRVPATGRPAERKLLPSQSRSPQTTPTSTTQRPTWRRPQTSPPATSQRTTSGRPQTRPPATSQRPAPQDEER